LKLTERAFVISTYPIGKFTLSPGGFLFSVNGGKRKWMGNRGEIKVLNGLGLSGVFHDVVVYRIY
jgi:hypothetical protein